MASTDKGLEEIPEGKTLNYHTLWQLHVGSQRGTVTDIFARYRTNRVQL